MKNKGYKALILALKESARTGLCAALSDGTLVEVCENGEVYFHREAQSMGFTSDIGFGQEPKYLYEIDGLSAATEEGEAKRYSDNGGWIWCNHGDYVSTAYAFDKIWYETE